jgi:DNA-binding Lrp family transcriptional regulator
MTSTALPSDIHDPVNAKILSVSEDRIQGYLPEPFEEIARLSGVDVETVLSRIKAMLTAGTIRRVRQTLMATNLATGALVAWQLPQEKIDAGFRYLFDQDPFSGHVVIRTTDTASAGSNYRLWTTLKVPQGYSLEKHCRFLAGKIGAEHFRIMPAKKLFVLGVGHVRRKGLELGSRAEVAAEVHDTAPVELSELEWRVLVPLKREFAVEEIGNNPWAGRAAEAGVSVKEFHAVASSLSARRVIGRFSTFLEHVKPLADGGRVTKFNALFHWAVPEGMQLKAGQEVGRHHIMTHAYWREGGPEFHNVNVMGVAHGTDKAVVLAHKLAIDKHLEEAGIPVTYTNVFWGGRSEIKPSEIAPVEYEKFCRENGIEPGEMKA